MRPVLRNAIEREEFDYQVLKSALADYASPRDRITALLRSGEIVRVKKGLYVFGAPYRRRPVCRELLANLMYGPSIVSLDYALAYRGLIPERVDSVTSVTTGRPRTFDTPLGRFVYRPTPCLDAGLDRVTDESGSFLIATAERALADRIRDDRGGPLTTTGAMKDYLLFNLRISTEDLVKLDPHRLRDLAIRLKSTKVDVCARTIAALQRGR